MNNSTLWKALIAAAAITLSIPCAMAGATNRGDNTAAQPGDNSTTTVNPDTPNQQRDSTGTDSSTNKTKHSRDRNRTSRTTGGDRNTGNDGSSDITNNSNSGSSKPSGNSNGGY
ncbi:RND transporter [Novimethylophilus kurashikiensis]|uniref:RND transporter n=1 Tax=Novimethylophilus kurashikiensis TaxID=1825523 RepID=A0A2R5F3A0_9PROT|nr:hypothetical protein [Novimethylophilus kurashikiensis]GBG12609.1 RND transporter [Novimethylophilus kurashikiensis]